MRNPFLDSANNQSKIKIFLALLVCAVAANTTAQTVPTRNPFAAVQPMNAARYLHTATLLNNGKVLIAGGNGPVTGGLASIDRAELFDPATGAFTPVSNMTSPRQSHTATLLPNGKILITGGTLNTVNGNVTYLNSAELFDPVTETFTAVAPMNFARTYHTATLLQNGKVLIVGGDHGDQDATNDTAEMFDPATGTFTLVANMMVEARSLHTTTTLQNGKVLIAGGGHLEGLFEIGTDTAELFDPASQTFTAAGVMSSVRYEHTATVLPNGKVLLAGGGLSGNIPIIGAIPSVTNVSHTGELFDPVSGTFSAITAPMTSPRTIHTATLLPNGKVLLAGGYNGNVAAPGVPAAFNNTAELFDPTSGMFTSLLPNTMTSARALHTATLMADGRVLLVGGFNGSAVSATAELADFSVGAFASLPTTMAVARYYHTATLLSSGKVLIAGGYNNTQGALDSAELFDPALGAFTSSSNTMTSSRYAHTATSLSNGKILLAGGLNASSAPTDAAELFDPDSSTFAALPAMTSARVEHTATLLPSGKVLITGGFGNTTYLKTAELFDPNAGTFKSLSHTMAIERHGHSATLLANGKVLIAGGDAGLASLPTNTAEIFDPITETFTSLPNTMTVTRLYPSATLLPNGKVLVAGGYDGSGYSDTAELFDPVSSTFTATPPMNFGRDAHSATLLSNGKVLIAGGVSEVSTSNTAELFDPALGTFSSLLPNTMNMGRQAHTATLLSNGQVLIAGGFTGMDYTNTAELFDAGLGFSNARRPVISSSTDPLVMPASLVLGGSGFQGDSEANGGMSQGSPTNYPVVQLMRIDNEQVYFPLSDPATNWSDSIFSSESLGTVDTLLPKGRYRVTVFTNGIPSIQKIIEINGTTVPLVPVTSIVSRKAHGDVAVFDIPLPLTGNPGIECRSGGANGDYTIIFTFANTLTSVESATFSSGTGRVNDSFIGSDSRQYVVILTGVSNAQVITVGLTKVADSIGNFTNAVSVSMGVLLGDVNSTRRTDSGDVTQVRNHTVSVPDQQTFRFDVNASGRIDAGDVTTTRNATVTVLP
jgi:hypothetical protein